MIPCRPTASRPPPGQVPDETVIGVSRRPAAGIRAGYDSLRGVRIDTLQLVTLAPLLAHHLGIAVEDA